MTTVDPRIQVRLSDDATAWLAGRSELMHTGSHHQQARIEIGLWRTALSVELRRIRLTVNQATCIADVLNSAVLTASFAGNVGLVWGELADAFQLASETPLRSDLATYGAKWGIDEQALLDYLRSLSPTADHALFDAVSRWWSLGGESTVDGWKAVGLRVFPDAVDSSDE